MPEFKAGTIFVDFVVATEKLSTGFKRVERLTAHAAQISAKSFEKNFKAKSVGEKLGGDLETGLSSKLNTSNYARSGFAASRFPGQKNREIAELDVARARGVFRSGFSDGLRAALDGDLGSFLEDKLKDLASNMFDRAVENFADAVFDQLAQIAPGFLGQITGNANLPSALSGATGAASSVATQAATGVAGQAASTGAQAAGATATATAVTTAMTVGGTTAATAIGTAMTTSGTVIAGQIAAAMASGGATSGLSNFAGAFATGGVIGSGKFGLVGEQGPELVSAGSGPIRITPLDGGRLSGFSTDGLESRATNQSPSSNVVMNISGIKDLGSFVKSQGTIEADMAAAMRRAQGDF